MKTIGINCGHTIGGPGYGAVGLIRESNHTRLVGYALMEKLKAAGVNVIDCTVDEAATGQEYLSAAVALANRQDLDWFISIHFNASASHNGRGAEVYTYGGGQYPEALDICAGIADLGFKNRGVKDGSGLYLIRKAKAKGMLIEVCFCDNAQDMVLYNAAGGPDGIAQALFNAVSKYAVDGLQTKPQIKLQTKSQTKPRDSQSPRDDQSPEGKLWVVQLRAYRSRRNAEAFVKRLEGMGIKSLLKLYDAE